jgi:hypothetical protein
LVFTTEAAIEAHIQKSHAGGQSFLPRPPAWQGRPDWQFRNEEEDSGDEDAQMDVPPMPPAETDNLMVMDWTEEDSVPAGSSVPPAHSSIPQSFAPSFPPQNNFNRPAFFPTGQNKHIMSPHDFRPQGISPMVIVEYFCKVCGEIVPRIRFCAHISGHFTDIYLPRTSEPPRCITGDFIQQGGVSRKQPTRKDDCRTCSQGGPGVARLRQALQQLTEIFGAVES